jgi:hypothetical protein
MALHTESPLVHVMQTPSSVGSHLQWPIVMLQEQTTIPLSTQQQLQSPPAIMVHKFCSIPAETRSSQAQMIFIPPVHFSKVIVHRGTIIMLAAVGAACADPIIPVAPGMLKVAIPIPVRSVFVAVDIGDPPIREANARCNCDFLRQQPRFCLRSL